MTKQTFKKGALVFKEGDTGSSMYEIVSGSVGVYVAYGTAHEKKLTELKAGACFGEMGILTSMPRSATIVAMGEGVELQEIGADEFDAYLDKNPEKVRGMLRELCFQLRDLTVDYVEVCQTVADLHETETRGEERSPELSGRMEQIVNIYQNRYPALFSIIMKEKKDDVRFVFDASRS